MRGNKRRTSSLQAVAVAAVCLLFAATALFGLYKCFSRPPELSESTLNAGQEQLQAAETESDAQTSAETSLTNRKDSFYTILLSGLDDENGGSDTNLLMALDAEGGSIHVVSLPRDTLLNVSWSVKKLNNAYHHGGITRTVEEVSNLLGIPVDYYVTVDLEAFVALVDAIGGGGFEIPPGIDYHDPHPDLPIPFFKGMRPPPREEAPPVGRWRPDNNRGGYPPPDIGPIGTQQAFLTAVAQQTLQLSNWDKIPAMAQIFREYVDTELTVPNLVWIGEQALTMGSENIHFHTLPGDGAGYYKGGSYYTVDPGATLELIKTYFTPTAYGLTQDDMDILVP